MYSAVFRAASDDDNDGGIFELQRYALQIGDTLVDFWTPSLAKPSIVVLDCQLTFFYIGYGSRVSLQWCLGDCLRS